MASQASSLRTTADSSVGPWCLSTGACLLSSRAHSFAFLYSLPLFPCLTPSVCLWNRLLTQFRKPKLLLQFPLSGAEPRVVPRPSLFHFPLYPRRTPLVLPSAARPTGKWPMAGQKQELRALQSKGRGQASDEPRGQRREKGVCFYSSQHLMSAHHSPAAAGTKSIEG